MNTARLLIVLTSTTAAFAADIPADHAVKMTQGLEMFRKDIAPLLREHCLKCHGGEKTKSDFDLATREGLVLGGVEGAGIKPFDSGASWMMKLIRHEEEPEMPEKKPKLADADIAKIAAWIDHGAPYDAPLVKGKEAPRDKAVVTDKDRAWWAFQPLSSVAVPKNSPHPVDAFLLKAAADKGLSMNPPTDARTLIRRASLDLTGLPPTPGEVADFLRDARENPASATSKLIDRLLASPAHGERWARHWLDVARFAESSGFEHDYDRPHAFHYRDFVIRALNEDMPFDQFAKWQIAGDEFAPGDSLALMATGFLGAGVFPTQITANEVERTRYDALDDMLSTTASAFLGLSVGCARCHDHKYDPIPTADYYRLLSTFTTTVRSNIDLEIDQEKNKGLREAWEHAGKALAADAAKVEAGLRPAFQQWLKSGAKDAAASDWTLLLPSKLASSAKATFKDLGDGSFLAEGKNEANDTYTITTPIPAQRITALRLEALTHPSMKGNGPGRAGNGNFGLGQIEVSLAPKGGAATDVKIARAFADHEQNTTNLSIAASLDGDPKTGWAVDGQIGKDHAAVFVFATPITPPPGSMLTLKLTFAVNGQHHIGRPRFAVSGADVPKLDGGVLPAPIVAALDGARAGKVLAAAEDAALFDWWKQRDDAWKKAQAEIAGHASKKPGKTDKVLVCAEGYPPLVMHSQGAPFLKETHLLKRGDTNQKDKLAELGYLQVLMRDADEKRWQWAPPEGAQYSGRRRSLANWMTDAEHGAGALMARVTVNRLWQHHFGRGLVATPNDFGKTGTLSSNPKLLDWLAGELVRNGWRLKPIHRLLMTSAAYQQSDAADAPKLAADPDNALFLRRIPQRLEAETVRDSALAASGVLDGTMFGAGSLDERSKRRSIYFTVKRSKLVTSMLVFDAPEPLASQGVRPVTTVAPQALLMMNSPYAREWATAFARRVEAETKSTDLRMCIDRAYEIALGRPAKDFEIRDASAFIESGIAAYAGKPDARTLALADFCQTVLALNEFIYVN